MAFADSAPICPQNPMVEARCSAASRLLVRPALRLSSLACARLELAEIWLRRACHGRRRNTSPPVAAPPTQTHKRASETRRCCPRKPRVSKLIAPSVKCCEQKAKKTHWQHEASQERKLLLQTPAPTHRSAVFYSASSLEPGAITRPVTSPIDCKIIICRSKWH